MKFIPLKKSLLLLITICLLVQVASAQKNVRSFIFGHSLIHHELQLNPTPSQETSVPHWFHFLAEAGGHDYALSGQYGFLPQHANLPPIAQWGFDFPASAWESDYEPFSAADFNNILITPGNFVQWQSPEINYPYEDVSPISATETIFNWCNQQEDSLEFYIYENWPDMGPYLSNGFPPTATEWESYNDYLVNDFHDWFIDYHDLLQSSFPNSCVSMIPVGPIISALLQESPFDQIPITALYEDDAPHGRPTIYFLAAMATYMAMYQEKAPENFQVDPIIHEFIVDNYQTVNDYIWDELNLFNDDNGNSRVFCSTLVTSNEELNPEGIISVFPNPVETNLYCSGLRSNSVVELFDAYGRLINAVNTNTLNQNTIDLRSLEAGVYIIFVKNEEREEVYQSKIIKL